MDELYRQITVKPGPEIDVHFLTATLLSGIRYCSMITFCIIWWLWESEIMMQVHGWLRLVSKMAGRLDKVN